MGHLFDYKHQAVDNIFKNRPPSDQGMTSNFLLIYGIVFSKKAVIGYAEKFYSKFHFMRQ